MSALTFSVSITVSKANLSYLFSKFSVGAGVGRGQLAVPLRQAWVI